MNQSSAFFVSFFLLLSFPHAPEGAEHSAGEKPNLLFLFTDDQRWDALGAGGNERIHTPNLDSLAARGTLFRNAFVTLSICSPSRAACLTGRYNSANGVTVVGKGTLNDGEVTFAHLLGKAGYRTGVAGKWHLQNTPLECGFGFSSICHGNGAWYGRRFSRNGEKVVAEGFVDDFVADESIAFVAEAAKRGEPFILWMCTQAPHMDHRHQWPPLEEYLKRYDIDGMPLAESWRDTLEGKPDYLKSSRSRTQALQYGYDRAEAIRTHNREYYASVEQLDHSIGRVLEALDRLGLWDNTWIVFMGDNGWMMGEHGFTSKVLPYEESIRVPLIVAGPGTKSRRNDELVLGIDLTATILEAAGIEIPKNLHGRSLLPFVRGETVSDWRTEFLYEAPEPQLGSCPLWAMRTKRWKYIETEMSNTPGDVFQELYDLESDSLELKNLAGAADHAGLIEQLSKAIRHKREAILAD